jgi:hypothetical protein
MVDCWTHFRFFVPAMAEQNAWRDAVHGMDRELSSARPSRMMSEPSFTLHWVQPSRGCSIRSRGWPGRSYGLGEPEITISCEEPCLRQ